MGDIIIEPQTPHREEVRVDGRVNKMWVLLIGGVRCRRHLKTTNFVV